MALQLTLITPAYIRGLNLAIRIFPHDDPYREYYESQICAVVNMQAEALLSGKLHHTIYDIEYVMSQLNRYEY